MKPVKIHISAIHHVEGPRLEDQLVEPESVALTGSGDVNTGGNRFAQIELSVHLNARVRPTKMRPRKVRWC